MSGAPRPTPSRTEASEPVLPSRIVLAAMRQELAPWIRRTRVARRWRVEDLHLWSGRLGRRPVLLGASGEGRRRAERAAELLDALAPEIPLVVVGVAGALSPELRAGALLFGERLVAADERGLAPVTPFRAGAAPPLPAGLAAATLVSVDRLVVDAADKQALWRQVGSPRPAAVDMESAFVVRVAARAERAVHVVRVVTDEAAESLPAFLARCRARDGSLSRTRMALHALRSPASLRAMAALRRRAGRGAERLAEVALPWLLEPADGPAGGER